MTFFLATTRSGLSVLYRTADVKEIIEYTPENEDDLGRSILYRYNTPATVILQERPEDLLYILEGKTP